MRRGDTLPLYISPFGCLVSCGWSFNWISFYLNRHNHHRHRHPSAQARMTLSELPINLSRKKYRSPPLSPPPSSSLLTTASPSSMKTKNTMPSSNHHRNIFFLAPNMAERFCRRTRFMNMFKNSKRNQVYMSIHIYIYISMSIHEEKKAETEKKAKERWLWLNVKY